MSTSATPATPRQRFEAELVIALQRLWLTPDYTRLREVSTPEKVAARLIQAFCGGLGDSRGRCVRQACKVLGIKPTWEDIYKFLVWGDTSSEYLPSLPPAHRFEAALTEAYTVLFEIDCNFAAAREVTTPAALAEVDLGRLQTAAVRRLTTGPKLACQRLNIEPTSEALRSFLGV